MRLFIIYLFVAVSIANGKILEYDLKASQTVDNDWWKTAVFYQIYPRSFKDSNGDGIGDLQGVIEKLDHLKDAGVTATWLSPIFKSPQVDQGYDISDYRDIDPDYGTLGDMKQLIRKAHDLGIKIILDFVPNHTSDKHDWFQKSLNKTSEYADYYVWKDCKKLNGSTQPPNNWISNFKGSAWQWNENRSQCYLHQFSTGQPDLNYRNHKVVEEMKDVLRFWLEFGADGFRMDAVPTLFEDEQLRDEPLSGLEGFGENDYQYLKHIYTTDQDETFDMIYQFREVLEEFNVNKSYPRIMMTEAYSDADKVYRYYGATNGTTLGAHFTFNFNFITKLNVNFTVDDVIDTIDQWLLSMPKQYTSNWVLGNHDNRRIPTRLGQENVDAFNMLVSVLPGVMVTYNGEEIGMPDGNVTCEQGYDPQAVNNCSTFDSISRDFERTPFQWDNSSYAGFTNGTTAPWLPVGDSYHEINLEAQNVQSIKSHYNVYKAVVNLRQAFRKTTADTLGLVKLSENVLQVIRRTDKKEIVFLFNAGDESVTVKPFKSMGSLRVVVASTNSNRTVNDEFSGSLGPHESLILEGVEVSSATNPVLSFLLLVVVFIVFRF